MTPDEAITVIIPTSPLAVHPSTEIIDETIAQVRKHLPEARILLLMDGVHPEEEYLRDKYQGFKRAIRNIERSNLDFETVEFLCWRHQSGMLKWILEGSPACDDEEIKTPLVFWTEHDIPLNDAPINWQGIVDTLLEGKIGGIRFELTGNPPKRNEVMGRVVTHGIPLTLSTQYVNWPQVFRLDYLKAFVAAFGTSKTYLECSEFDNLVGRLWSKWQYGIYSPDPIIRCYHTNGRCAGGYGDPGKPFIIVNGKQRNIYDTPYKPLF